MNFPEPDTDPIGGVYFLHDLVCDRVKVGMSRRDLVGRVADLRGSSLHDLQLFAAVYTHDPARLESELHHALRVHRERGEWFRWPDAVGAIVHDVVETHLAEIPGGFVEVTTAVRRSPWPLTVATESLH